MRGKIIRGVGGFYYIHTTDGVYECRARGIFRLEKKKPLVGDDVEITVLHEKDAEGNLEEIYPRKNMLIRPACANVDQALLLFAAANPEPNLNLLDRFLLYMDYQDIPVLVAFNKKDLISEDSSRQLAAIYEHCGKQVRFLSLSQNQGTDELRELLRSRTTVLAGPSGVGKSSFTNFLQAQVQMEVGEVSRKIQRGRHTTRHAELIPWGENSYILDTPGFSSLNLPPIESSALGEYFPEFQKADGSCRYAGCMHLSEPGCAVKKALEEGKISPGRYENYTQFVRERQEQEKYRFH